MIPTDYTIATGPCSHPSPSLWRFVPAVSGNKLLNNCSTYTVCTLLPFSVCQYDSRTLITAKKGLYILEILNMPTSNCTWGEGFTTWITIRIILTLNARSSFSSVKPLTEDARNLIIATKQIKKSFYWYVWPKLTYLKCCESFAYVFAELFNKCMGVGPEKLKTAKIKPISKIKQIITGKLSTYFYIPVSSELFENIIIVD